jgi:hypothetical protein
VDEVDALVAAGALDDVDQGLRRGQLRVMHRRLRWSTGKAPLRRGAGQALLETVSRRAAELRDELGALGFTLSGHPLDIVRCQLGDDVVDASALSRCIGSRVRVGGWLAGRKPIAGLHRSWMCELDDGTALFEARVPDRLIDSPLAGPWSLVGVVRAEGGRLELVVDEAEPLDLDTGGLPAATIGGAGVVKVTAS